MRILYVINSVEGGGAALPVPMVARLLAHHGAVVMIAALTERDGRALPAFQAAQTPVMVRQGGERDHLAAALWLDRLIATCQPDLIWTSLTRATLIGQLVARRRGLPVVSWQHAAFLKPANLRLLRATQRLSALWIGDSHSITDLTARRLAVPPERLATWPLFAADPAAPQAAPWSPGRTLRLGALGRLHPVKGHDVLIAALAHMRAQGYVPPVPFEVEIAGEGAEREPLLAAISEAGLENVRLTGFAAQPLEFLARLHLFLQPSRSEGLCIAVHEAMQAGLPCLVSSVGELPYSMVPGETGGVVPPGDPEALARALMLLLADPERLAIMGAAARSRVLSKFGEAAFAQAGAEVFARLPVKSRRRSEGPPPGR